MIYRIYLQFYIAALLQVASSSLVRVPAVSSLLGNRRRFLSTTGTTAAGVLMTGTSLSSINAQPPPVRWGIIGLGDVTEKKSGPPFFKCKGSSLVAVMRRTPGKAAEWARRMVPGGQCVGYDDLEEFLRHDGLDAVYIATPPGSHLDLCRKVAAAGKAVYVEKPVGRCAAETREMVRCMQEAGKPFYTAYISRAYERTQALRGSLRDGCIGDRVERVEYKFVGNVVPRGFDPESPPWRVVAQQAGGGEVMDIGCHIVDRVDYLCGPFMNVKGSARNKNSPEQLVEDFVQLEATIGPSDWAAIPSESAKISCSWDFSGLSNSEAKDELTITGPKGHMKMIGMTPSLPIFVYNNDGDLIKQVEFSTPEHTGQPLIQAVTDDLRGVSRDPFLSVGDNAVRASDVLDTALESYYGGREIGFWDRPESWPGKPKN